MYNHWINVFDRIKGSKNNFPQNEVNYTWAEAKGTPRALR